MSLRYKTNLRLNMLLRVWIYLVVKKGYYPVRAFGIERYTLLYFKWRSNKDLLHSTGNSAQCYVAAGMRENLGEIRYMRMYG